MRKRALTALAVAIAAVPVAVPATGWAHGEKGELYVPWADSFTEQRGLSWLKPRNATNATNAKAAAAAAAPVTWSENLTLVGNSDKDGVTNSDLAFRGSLVYSGNYAGFRILDTATGTPRTVVDFTCNGPQNDVSVHEMGGRTFLFQSVDTAQDREDCSSANAPLENGSRVGYEGVRVFDVTNPAAPKFIDMIQTACGSHTHTLIPDGQRAFIYVSSYPLGSNVTPPNAEGPGDAYKPCFSPHKKISIIEVSTKNGEFRSKRKEQRLSDQTAFNRGFQACHDVQVLMARKIALGSCAGDAQLWDISDPWNPTTDTPGKHTHITSPSSSDQFEFIHSGVFTWDGKYLAIMDETGGGVTANCFGDQTTDGYYYFYPLVEPGQPAPDLISRYSIPRDQGQETCVSHNASVIPVKDKYVMSAAYYQGGVSVVDFTDVKAPREVAWADLEDGTGLSDEWSSYWYNGRIYSNSGLGRRGATGNRGLDVFAPSEELGLGGAKEWAWSNPQTQESWQAP
jgi:hypothetical protein